MTFSSNIKYKISVKMQNVISKCYKYIKDDVNANPNLKTTGRQNTPISMYNNKIQNIIKTTLN